MMIVKRGCVAFLPSDVLGNEVYIPHYLYGVLENVGVYLLENILFVGVLVADQIGGVDISVSDKLKREKEDTYLFIMDYHNKIEACQNEINALKEERGRVFVAIDEIKAKLAMPKK